MRLLTFFLVMLVLSLVAVGATTYWRTYHPAEMVAEAPPAPSASGEATTGASGDDGLATAKKELPSGYKASRTQDLANTLSIASSVISAFGALISAWFAYARWRDQKRLLVAAQR